MTSASAGPTVPTFLERLAAEHGGQELIVADAARLTYAAARERSARLARALLASGVGKGTRVGLLAPNGPEWVVAFLAATRIGAVLVPLNTFFQAKELGWILRHADVHTLLTVPRFLSHDYVARLLEAAPELADAGDGPLRAPTLPYLRAVWLLGDGCDAGPAWTRDGAALEARAGDDAAVDDALLSAVEAQVTPADAMVILYSSGSTADPKGAVHTHGSVLRHAAQLRGRRDLKPDDRVWSPMPFFWVGGFVFALLSTLDAGACMLVEDVFEPEGTLRFLERERASVAVGWPHFGKALAEHPSRVDRDLSALRAGNVPDILPPEVAPSDPELRPNALGMTETCGPHTWSQEGALPESLRGTCGQAVDAVEHLVVDPETGARVASGEVGEIWVRGRSLMQALYKQEREAVFEPDGFYRTGDAGSFDAEGYLRFQGRLGDMIKTGGANVTPSEVEQVLLGYEDVKEAYVVGVPDPDRGENVAAAVVPAAGSDLDAETLRTRVKGDLSAYKVPRHWFVLGSDALPYTDSGKIDKRRLTAQLSAALTGSS